MILQTYPLILGAVVPPRLVVLKYKGNPSVKFEEDENVTALVGKGITFDTGGINLKPSGSIEDMYLDMRYQKSTQ